MPPFTQDSFFLSPITPENVQYIIDWKSGGKAVGPSSVPVSILETLKSASSESPQIIFNTSFLTGIVPERFKLARVMPTFKRGTG